MATGFELRVRRLIDIGPKPINWSNSSPFQRMGGRVDAFRFPPPCVRGCVCHQTARPCLKFRAIQPWNIDIPCQRSRIPQGRHQRTLFATDYIHRRNMHALLRYLPDKTRNSAILPLVQPKRMCDWHPIFRSRFNWFEMKTIGQ